MIDLKISNIVIFKDNRTDEQFISEVTNVEYDPHKVSFRDIRILLHPNHGRSSGLDKDWYIEDSLGDYEIISTIEDIDELNIKYPEYLI